jgi:hypothetical protein
VLLKADVAGQDATEQFFGLHRAEVLTKCGKDARSGVLELIDALQVRSLHDRTDPGRDVEGHLPDRRSSLSRPVRGARLAHR